MPRDLRQLAATQPCYLRLYPFCRQEPGNVVLAHIRRGNTAGVGMKPVDLNGAPACFYCHEVYDGKAQKIYTRNELDAQMLRAHCQWIDWLWKHEIVVVVLAA